MRACAVGRPRRLGRFDVLSLDVFDTLVWRRPNNDAFFLVGDAPRARRHALVEPRGFVRERWAPSARASRAGGDARRIYAEFPCGYLTAWRRRICRRSRSKSSARSCARIPPCAICWHARAAGMTTALVSDFYCDRRQIRLLTGVGVDHVSCRASTACASTTACTGS
jgi:hypothetical protein